MYTKNVVFPAILNLRVAGMKLLAKVFLGYFIIPWAQNHGLKMFAF